MKYEFSVFRKTIGIDEHTVIIEAGCEEEARQKIAQGQGEYLSLDRDELVESEISAVRSKTADPE